MKLLGFIGMALMLWASSGHTTQRQPDDIIALPGGQLYVTLAPTIHRKYRTKITKWLTSSGNAVATAYGKFPLSSIEVLVALANRGKGPVPFGQVVRVGGTQVKLLVNPAEPLAAFLEDWTAIHEFSHLMLPYLHRDDAWLSEGIATYYQYVLRVRAGLISEQQAWQKIGAGLERGRKDTHPALTLRQVSQQMSRRGGFMRVYWSGLVYALTVDLRLRQRVKSNQSLDRALRGFHDCCLPSDREWSAAEFVARLDLLLATDELTREYRKYPNRRDFPAVEATLKSFGVSYHAGQLQIDDAAANAAIRHQIMTGSVSYSSLSK